MSSGGGPQLSTAFIDLATYGELESYMYGPVDTRDYNGMYPLTKGVKQSINMIIILVIIFLIYIKR
jgi:hypothetical protein